ncbi:MAG: response regulator, partial [Rhodospirillaceae bacterium]|nr:response regulator [Rhodospirillaceae bacterium]
RKALRSGAAYVLPAGLAAASLDRNIHHIFGRPDGGSERASAGDTLASVDISTLANRHVLVLEDRLVNQTIIQRQLKKLHMTCTIAGNGIAGLDRLAAGHYDMVLCDCSMPEMNGYEFTRIVRQREQEKGGDAHLPIIAMTANAFREDMEKCFAAGMDDFISKPVTLLRLASVLSQWTPKTSNAEETQMTSGHTLDAPSASAPVSRHAPAVELPVLQRLLGSTDHAILADIVKEFIPCAQESWLDVQRAMAGQDAEALHAAAHGAKGEARNMGATVLGDLYEAVEDAAKRGDLAAVEKMLGAIPTELQRVQDFVDEFITKAAE